MGLSHSKRHKAKHEHVKIYHDNTNCTAHVSDDDSIEYQQLTLYDSDNRHATDKSGLPWWRNLLSRLTRSRNMSTPEINTPHDSHETNSFDSDADTALSSTPPPQYFTSNDYVQVPTESIRVGCEKCESFVIDAEEWGNSSSYEPEVNGLNQTENEDSALTRKSRSPARPYIQTKQECVFASDGINHPEPEEVSIAEAEFMYTKATWRMYERITSSRTAAAVANERFRMPNVLPPSNGNVAYSPTREKCQRGCMAIEEMCQEDQTSGLGSSVDRHDICFEMDQD